MAEAAPATTEQAPAASTQEAPKQETSSLDDVYKKYNVDSMVQEFSAKPQPKQEAPQEIQRTEPDFNVPDPVLDPSGYKNFLARDAREKAGLKQALNELRGQLTSYQRERLQQTEEADIRKAVDKVNEFMGDGKLDPDVVEISLGVEAKRDPRFFALWNNRNKNPEAFQAAMKAVAGKLGKKFSMRADPQIAENQRALREATSTKATTAPEPSQDDKLGKLQGDAFRRAMQDIANGRSPRGV